MSTEALIVVDVQKDFTPGTPGGALAVPDGDEVVPVANRCINQFKKEDKTVVATQDWHPPEHLSFAEHHDAEPFSELNDDSVSIDTVWPTHCVQHSEGAEFEDYLNTDKFDQVFQKGLNPEVDSYSGFYDNNHEESSGLSSYLKSKGVDETYILGLAEDVCVYFTVLDSIREGFKTNFIEDGTRGINPDQIEEAHAHMKEEGAYFIESSDVVEQ